MNILIHDLSSEQFQSLFSSFDSNTYIVSDTGTIHDCIGCFGCWIKDPGKCVLHDGYENMGALLSQAEKVTIISKCYYGCYSPFVKNVLDRSISYLLPFFRIENSETHHRQRYENSLQLSVRFYGEAITDREMQTARELVKANSVNFYVRQYDVSFFQSAAQLCRGASL